LPILDPVDLGNRPIFEGAFKPIDNAIDPVETSLDAAPAGFDEIDDQRKVLHTRACLGIQVALEALEPADRLSREPAQLGDVTRDG
jgi:hypothetical protein